MKSQEITSFILCGGSGTRLWPFSRKSFPKLFVFLILGENQVQLTLEHVGQISPQARLNTVFVESKDHGFLGAQAKIAKNWVAL